MKKERLSKLTKLLHSIPSTNGERLLIELTELSENLGLSENTIERLKTELKDGKGYLDKYFPNIEMDNSINHLLKDNEGLKSKLKKWCELELASIITDIIGNRKYAMGVARVLSIKYMESRNSMKSSLVISKLNNKKDNLKDLDESIIVETSGGNEVEIFVEDNSQKSSFPIPRYFLFGLIDALAQDSNHPLKKVRLKGIKHENGTYEVQISNYLEDQWPLPDIEDLLQEPDHDRNVRFWIKCLNDLLPLKKGIVCKINKESKPYSINICWEECDPEKYNTSVQFEQKPVEVDTRDYNDLSFDEVKQIADTGVMMAQTNLAERYFFGAGIEQDYKKAFDYYSNSAEMGDIKAQYKLGFSLINALGTESSFQEGVEWLKKAADQDCEHALFYLGSKTLLDSITSGVEIEFLTKDMSADYSKRAANSGNKQAQVQIGSDYSIADVKQIDEIHRWFRTAADQGYAEAFYQLGIINMGNDENQKDLERAFQFFSRASKLQHSGAQNMLGEMYFNGMFKNTNKKLAIDLFERAEKQGCPYSQMKLGLIEFLKLSDEPENLTRAVGYFEEVIKFGWKISMFDKYKTIAQLINAFISYNDTYKFVSFDDIDNRKLEKISNLIEIFESKNETIYLYADLTFLGNGKKVLLVGQNRIAWTVSKNKVFVKPFNWDGFQAIDLSITNLDFKGTKLSLIGFRKNQIVQLKKLISLLHAISFFEEETKKTNTREIIINTLCEKGFPMEKVKLPLNHVLQMCVVDKMNLYRVLDSIEYYQIEWTIENDHIVFFTQ